MGCYKMNTHTSTFSNKTITYNILDELKVNLSIQENPYQLSLDDLFEMAARINKKRAFLFVSKVLGKHIPILPQKGIHVGALLAARYLQVVKGITPKGLHELRKQFNQNDFPADIPVIVDESNHPLIIGFAETATALGHAFFEAFRNAEYFHTTREQLLDVEPIITFEEEHSHATSHRAYLQPEWLDRNNEIILVDDEITTGRTTINIIRSIHEKFPRDTYTIVSILDWRLKEHLQQFQALEKELGITIRSVSLIKGTVDVKGTIEQANVQEVTDDALQVKQQIISIPVALPSAIYINGHENAPYTRFTGRFGITSEEQQEVIKWTKEVAQMLKKYRNGSKTLVLGSGEFMYLPMKIAAYMGENVYYQSTTRSPIYPLHRERYGVKNRFSFLNPEDDSVQHYAYNIHPNQYDDIFLFLEKEVEFEQLRPKLDELKKTQITDIKIVYLSEKEGASKWIQY